MADYVRGETLQKLRKERRLSQEDAAHEIGVTAKTLREWEKGGPIKWENAKRAGAFYEVAPEQLVTREPEETSATAPGATDDELLALQGEVRQLRTELLSAIEVVRRGQASLLRHQGLSEPRSATKDK